MAGREGCTCCTCDVLTYHALASKQKIAVFDGSWTAHLLWDLRPLKCSNQSSQASRGEISTTLSLFLCTEVIVETLLLSM